MVRIKQTFTKLFYGVGNLGYSTVSQTEANLIMYFGTAVLGLPGIIMGIMVAISVCWDAISDPVIGYWSDNTNNPIIGKRHGFLLIGTIGMAVSNLFLWQISPEWSLPSKAICVFVVIMVLETCNTFFASPHAALGVEMATDTHDRAKIMSIRVVFFLLGMLMPSALMMVFSAHAGEHGQISGEQLLRMGYAISVICLVCGLLCFFGTLSAVKRTPPMVQQAKKSNLKSIVTGFFSVFSSREKRAVIFGYATSQLSSAFLTASGLHMFTFSFHFSSVQISVLMLALFGSAILSQPFWLRQSKSKGKMQALIAATQLAIVGTLLLALVYVFSREIPHLSFAFSLTAIALCGFGIGALFSLPIAIYSDMIMEKQESSNSCATQLGFLSFAFKFANALGLVLVGALLDMVKFQPNMPVQSQEVQNRLAIIVLSGIVLSFVVSIVLYRLGGTKVVYAQTHKKRGRLNELKTN